MADRLWRMPFAAEMHAFEAEIRGDQHFAPGRNAKHSTIIADAFDDARAWSLHAQARSLVPDSRDQL
jgi:hypothetical protein